MYPPRGGHFFGEVAALRRAGRSATVIAVTRVSLLVLDAQDLRSLMEREPRIAARIHQVVNRRVGGEQLMPRGDILSEELADEKAPTVGTIKA